MAEAVITRAGSGGGADISSTTKSLLGLTNDATLDDALQSLAYRGSDYATVMIKLLNPDGSNATDGKIRMNDGSSNIIYSADEYGNFTFKTNKPQCIFVTDEQYLDIVPNTITIDTVVGTLKQFKLTRTHRNASNVVNLTTPGTSNVFFSQKIKSVNVTCYGGGGGGWSGYSSVNFTGQTSSVDGTLSTPISFSRYNHYQGNYYGGNGYINSKVINISPGNGYQCIIGRGGTGGDGTRIYPQSVRLGYSFEYRATSNEVNGSTGGTTSFGSIIAAAGGAGCNSSANGAGGTGMSGGHGSSGSYWYDGYSSGSTTGTVRIGIRAIGTSGSNGMIQFSNFTYM